MQVTASCGHTFQTKQAPCPDGRVGCMVAHYNQESFICPECGLDTGPEVRKAMLEGPWKEELGMGVYNPAALQKLEMYNGS